MQLRTRRSAGRSFRVRRNGIGNEVEGVGHEDEIKSPNNMVAKLQTLRGNSISVPNICQENRSAWLVCKTNARFVDSICSSVFRKITKGETRKYCEDLQEYGCSLGQQSGTFDLGM